MRRTSCALAALLLVSSLASGCASDAEMRLLHQPALPSVSVAKAAPYQPLYHNVSVQDVDGAPEFRLFDGGGIITTRPTRREVLKALIVSLDRADLLAPSRRDGEYMLYTDFKNLHGPDVWWGSEKVAAAQVTFRLVRWRTREVVKTATFNTSYRAADVGLLPEEARAWGAALALAVVGASEAGTAAVKARANEFVGRPTAPNAGIGPFDGTARRAAAVSGFFNLAFDQFMHELSRDGSVRYKKAVSCRELNPEGYGIAFLSETADAYAVDCPGATSNPSPTTRVYPLG